MKEIIEKAKGYKNIILFGYGHFGKQILYMLEKSDNHTPVCVCDSYKKGGGIEDGILILSPEIAASSFPNALWCITSVRYKDEIRKEIIELGINESDIWTVIEGIWRMTPRACLQTLDYHLAEHCNLKCRGCRHFSNIAEEAFASIETFTRDISRMSEIIDGNLKNLLLLGGEPLLNKNINSFIETSRKVFPDTQILLVTNGVLLDSMPLSFWERCRDCNCVISISEYPVNLKYSLIEDLAYRYGVTVKYARSKGNAWIRTVLDLDGLQDADYNFRNCLQANRCVQLQGGLLYPCSIQAGIRHFNKKFNMNLTYDGKKDVLDIYKVDSAEEVYKFCATPPSFCKYCDFTSETKRRMEWSLAEASLSDYTF